MKEGTYSVVNGVCLQQVRGDEVIETCANTGDERGGGESGLALQAQDGVCVGFAFSLGKRTPVDTELATPQGRSTAS